MKANKIKKVLIALDYDPTAQKVAEIGYSMARAMKAEVILLHVISDPIYYLSANYSSIMGFGGFTNVDPLQLDNIKELKKGAQRFLDKSKQHLGGTAIHTAVKEGHFAETILKTAKNLHADVIVMGSHSRRWLEDIVMGSVAEDVLRHTLVPLFIIPTQKKK